MWDRVRPAAVALLLASAVCPLPHGGQAAAQGASTRVDIAAHVAEAAQRFGIPEQWIWAVMRAESAGRIGAISSAGAQGLMQLMPATWSAMRDRHGLGRDPFDPRDNILAGAAYLRELYDRYGASGFLAAYNAGPGRYEDWRDKGRPLPAETRAYVASIAPSLQAGGTVVAQSGTMPVQPVRTPWPEATLFAARLSAQAPPFGETVTGTSHSAAGEPARPDNGLFAPVTASRSQ